MKYGIISDLHLDHWPAITHKVLIDKINSCDADIILNAGDLYENPMYRKQFISEISKPNVLALGNHDFYGGIFSSCCGVYGSEIAYATLWTNFRNGLNCELEAKKHINDFYLIDMPDGDRITPSDMIDAYHEHLKFLKKAQCKIVMTHFGPNVKSVDPKFGDSQLNGYFINDISDKEILEMDVKLWIHGHTHSSCDYTIGGCRVVCNPMGYPYENYKDANDYQVKIVIVE